MQKTVFVKFAALAVASVLSQAAFAADGTINFTGEIVDAPCSISPNSQNLTVPLGKVSRTVFDGATAGTAVVGKKTTPARFKIDLLGCGATAKGATVTFSGTADLDDATNLRLATLARWAWAPLRAWPSNSAIPPAPRSPWVRRPASTFWASATTR
jgi:major type 1 subunit fimbrin (pilin)